MIGCDAEQADEVFVPMRCGPACLGDAQGVDRIDTLGRLDAGDLLPLETLVAIQLVPGQFANLAKRIQCRVALGLLQRQQVVLKTGLFRSSLTVASLLAMAQAVQGIFNVGI